MAAGTICETGETGENAVVGARFRSIVYETVNKSNPSPVSPVFPPFPLSLQKSPFEAALHDRLRAQLSVIHRLASPAHEQELVKKSRNQRAGYRSEEIE
jgi:hypothetical protein